MCGPDCPGSRPEPLTVQQAAEQVVALSELRLHIDMHVAHLQEVLLILRGADHA